MTQQFQLCPDVRTSRRNSWAKHITSFALENVFFFHRVEIFISKWTFCPKSTWRSHQCVNPEFTGESELFLSKEANNKNDCRSSLGPATQDTESTLNIKNVKC